MTPERLRRIEQVFHDARDKRPADREAFLASTCAGDPALRSEVESLLDAAEHRVVLDEIRGPDSQLRAHVAALIDRRAEDSQVMAPEPLPRLPNGTALGPYRIDTLVGAGGMGQVYAATDTRLHRRVAIKVLLTDLARHPAFTARFEREAQALAVLNHPGIAAIYGLETDGGVQALVLEFVEGSTLAEYLARVKRVPMTEALEFARQIAGALEAAHEHGIVHRDLKPSNIKITPGGTVKLLDFGVARIAEADAGPRTTLGQTDTGVILGTAAYMSPEQARGQTVDKRSDIWAFGCVLYEMLTGKGAFAADTASDSVAKLITHDPDWEALSADVPPAIRRLLGRCLQKNPADRLHDIADARIEVADALSATGRIAEIDGGRNRSRTLATFVMATLVVATLALVFWLRATRRPGSFAAQPLEFGITFPNNFMPTDGIAISPDGRRLAANVWANSGNIWLHSFDGSQPKPLAGAENAAYPFWSPDSATIGFSQSNQLTTMSPAGGQVTRVARLPPGSVFSGATWNRSNVIVYSTGTALFRVPASGASEAAQILLPDFAGQARMPVFLPDGHHFLVCQDGGAVGSLKLASLDGGEVKTLGESQCPGGTFAPPDTVLFLRGGSLFAQTLDQRRLSLEGEPRVVASGINRGAVGPWPALTPSASDTGVLAIPTPRGGSSVGQLTWFNRAGATIGTIATADDGSSENLNAAISPTNDNLIAVNRLDQQTGAWHVWLIDGSRNNAASRLTTDSASDVDPVWSPDGAQILYRSDRNGGRALYRQPIASPTAERVLDVGELMDPISSDWSSDGYLLFQLLQQSIWRLRLGEHVPVRLAEGESRSYGPHLSPNGNWLAYSAARAGKFELFVERFPQGSPRKQVSTSGGVHPRWTKGGSELVYWAPPGGIVANELALTDQDIGIGPTQVLVAQPVLTLIDARTHFDVTRNGQKILMRQPAGPPTPGVRVIVNWSAKPQ